MTLTLLEKYQQSVPRYTSYPTAPLFHSGVGPAEFADWLAGLSHNEPASLYVHVPFCDSLCWFCGCHTKIVNKYAAVETYMQDLYREIDLIADLTGPKLPVAHLHFGGGSPTILDADDVSRIMTCFRAGFDFTSDYEFALEVDPRFENISELDAWLHAGVNRVSIGVQSFDPVVQRATNRIQSFSETKSVIDYLRAGGVRGVNLDLMYGLPLQTVAMVESTIDQAVSLVPDRLALFGYAHVPWMRKHQELITNRDLPNAEARFEQAQTAAARLKSHGYVQIGLDHFARPDDSLALALKRGTLRRNFQGYTTDTSDTLIGFGASAISSLPQGYAQNKSDIRDYRRTVAAGELACHRGLALGPEDRARRDLIQSLMCDFEINLQDFRQRHDLPVNYFDGELDALRPLAEDGIVAFHDNDLTITDIGRPWLRTVCAVFDSYLAGGAGRHSAAI